MTLRDVLGYDRQNEVVTLVFVTMTLRDVLGYDKQFISPPFSKIPSQ